MIQEIIMGAMSLLLALLALNKALEPTEESPPIPIHFRGKVSMSDKGVVRITLKDNQLNIKPKSTDSEKVKLD
jgi:hypothetical protein